MPAKDYYRLLEVSPGVAFDEIRKAYRRLALLYHPDRNPGDIRAAEKIREINEAYEVLSDPVKRASYDAGLRDRFGESHLPVPEYLHAEVDLYKVRLNEEIELTYSFPGEGRFFKKPVLHGWLITAGPTVDYRYTIRDGYALKETVLHYTLCPMQKGILNIPGATIHFHHHPVHSNRLQVEVGPNQCFFSKGEEAGATPCRVVMHRTQVTSTTVYRKTIIHRRVVLIPRSDLAAWYHRVGRIMKVVLTIAGAFWALAYDRNFFLGALAGSFIAGINVQIMYRLMGIKPVFYYAHHHPLVMEYESYGYKLGPEPNDGIFGSRKWEFIKSLFI